ncbi:hypothetical protein OIU74_015868 [Salix koriyanagi]|uniref:Uncharacterized protein n=1 Tax=Salix koriyanagi TaxID=2511006 RepID=A0A9Q0PNV0_9ROSI|nr:hypothetical protein OIU74_015868 [Salix koriyanagi]
MCVGWFWKNSRVDEVPGTLPISPSLASAPSWADAGLGRLLIQTPKEMGCRNLLGVSHLPNSLSLPHWLHCRTLLRTDHAYRFATTHYVLDATLLVSTNIDMACSTLLQQASSPAAQS